MHQRRTTKLAAIGCAAVATLLAAGCSSSSKSASAPTTTSATSSAPASSAVSSPAAPTTAGDSSGPAASSTGAGSSKLAAIVVQASDLPAGWTSTPSQPDPKDAAEQATLVTCVGGKSTAADHVATQDSPDFTFNGAQVSSSADSFKTQADIAADVAIIDNPKVSACYLQLLKSELPSSLPAGSTLTSATFAVKPGAAGGPANVVGVGSGTIVVTTAGKPITLYIDVAFITGPLTEVNVTVTNPTQPVPAAFFATLTKTVATRAAKA